MNSLRFWRTEQHLSQSELAEASLVPRYAIQLHEQNVRTLSPEYLQRIADTLGLKVTGTIFQLPESNPKNTKQSCTAKKI